jgi:Domain of unknown function (DUF4190)
MGAGDPAGQAGDPAGQEGPDDGLSSSGDQPQPGNSPQYGQPPFGQPQYGQAGPYGQFGQPGPYGQPGMMPSRPANSLAIAALCCGVAQVIAGPLAGIPAIILGFMSLGQIERSGEQGRGLAVTGLVLGIVGTILFIVVILVFVAAYQNIQSTGLG